MMCTFFTIIIIESIVSIRYTEPIEQTETGTEATQYQEEVNNGTAANWLVLLIFYPTI